MTIQFSKFLTIASLTLALYGLSACAKEPAYKASSEVSGKAESIANNKAMLEKQTDSAEMTDAEAEAWFAKSDDGKIELILGDVKIRVEYADSPQERQLGLMYRKELCETCGMLFKFDSERVASIWMKNTFIPLDLAYITKAGEIIDIEQLEPHNLKAVRSTDSVLYALEMNEGWFAKNKVNIGTKVKFLP